ncbi:hypothetical protein [Novilysobacter selenitireducens]|uniref:RiboL-PSP-HEPN domain-containing protein n=1 Tax=Novilysobacter selenitireducens TaxID=2872639 RepID=A0ABS7T6Y8_9GAMM|nr:hypothetical protein [Lysobacter selenitireducens]MBZ4039651.1 hypothetical protein [Lysobacter selenitireducens]
MSLQLLEQGLKHLLPLVDLEGAPDALSNLKQRADKVSLKTLGALGGRFLENVTTSPDLDAELDQLIKERNQLVHHFHSCGLYDLSSIEGCEAAARRLEAQHHKVRRLMQVVDLLLHAAFEAACETTFAGTPEYVEFRALCDEFASSRGVLRHSTSKTGDDVVETWLIRAD